jgi:hypothetical protein
MEKVFPREERTDIAEVFLREIESTAGGASGRVVFFPWDIDRTFWEVLSTDHLKLMQNAVRWAARDPSPVDVTGPGVIEVTAWRQRDSMTVHLVNLTNPMMMKGPVRELMPVGEQRVRVQLPAGHGSRAVRLLVAGTTPEVRRDGGVVEVTVPSILAHEVVAIDLAPG